jgi:ADP-heptose:LPS heptosyltransferase
MTAPRSVLIVNPFGIGDVLFTTPLVRALRRAFPEARLAYLCNRRTEPILRHNPHLDELIVYERDEMVRHWRRSIWQGLRELGRLLRRVRHLGADVVVDVSLGERYSFILGALGARRRVGFDFRRRGRFLTEALVIDGYHEEHVVRYYRRLLRFMGVACLQDSLELPVSDADRAWASAWVGAQQFGERHHLVGLVPAGGVSWGIDASFRRWHAEGVAAVGDALAERYAARIILFGEQADQPVCRRVAELMRHPALDVSGQTTLGQFVSLLGRMTLVVCNDGGPLHLAVSQGVRTVSVFGPVDPQVYGPYPVDGGRHEVVCREDLPCRPCYRQFRLPPCPYERACLTTIGPEAVVMACRRVLDGAVPREAVALHG